jgi:hypothetical protein
MCMSQQDVTQTRKYWKFRLNHTLSFKSTFSLLSCSLSVLKPIAYVWLPNVRIYSHFGSDSEDAKMLCELRRKNIYCLKWLKRTCRVNSSRHGYVMFLPTWPLYLHYKNQTPLMFLAFFIFILARQPPPQRTMASSFTRFLDHTQRRTTVGRTPLDEWSDRRRDLYLTTHNTHNTQTSITTARFEPIISAGERPHTYALDRVAIGTGFLACSLLT